MIRPKPRVILDTNLLVSRALAPQSLAADAVRIILDRGHLMVSQATMDEFATVIARVQPKGYIKPNEAIALIRAYKECAEWVPILERIVACRDPKDDKFLELAVNGKADYLVTGDQDLLILHPFRDIRILTAKAFIDSLLS